MKLKNKLEEQRINLIMKPECNTTCVTCIRMSINKIKIGIVTIKLCIYLGFFRMWSIKVWDRQQICKAWKNVKGEVRKIITRRYLRKKSNEKNYGERRFYYVENMKYKTHDYKANLQNWVEFFVRKPSRDKVWVCVF